MIKINVTDEMVRATTDAVVWRPDLEDVRAAVRAVLDIVGRDLNTGKSDGVLNCSEHDMGDCPYHRGPSREVWSAGCIEVTE